MTTPTPSPSLPERLDKRRHTPPTFQLRLTDQDMERSGTVFGETDNLRTAGRVARNLYTSLVDKATVGGFKPGNWEIEIWQVRDETPVLGLDPAPWCKCGAIHPPDPAHSEPGWWRIGIVKRNLDTGKADIEWNG